MQRIKHGVCQGWKDRQIRRNPSIFNKSSISNRKLINQFFNFQFENLQFSCPCHCPAKLNVIDHGFRRAPSVAATPSVSSSATFL